MAVARPEQQQGRPGIRRKDAVWPWSDHGVGFGETCWVGTAL